MREDSEPGPPAGILPPSGRQTELVSGAAAVVVTEVGGGIRSFEIGGEPVLFGYPAGELCSGGKGQVLAPWPNRLEDGSYTFEGVAATAALDEPEHANAIHGLVRWSNWEVSQQAPDSANMGIELAPQPGYPWRIRIEVSYQLATASELRVSVRATNLSATRAPFGVGFHPYVDAGPGGVDACSLRFAAAGRLVADERGLPGRSAETAGTEYEFERGRALGGRRLDDCFFGLGEEADWSATLQRGDGREVTLTAGPEFAYLMCYTADTLPPRDRRRGVALEPMTCPPNAFRSLDHVVALEPAGSAGAFWISRWRITASGW